MVAPEKHSSARIRLVLGPASSTPAARLTSAFSRLEAATSRLEDIASTSAGYEGAAPSGPSAPATAAASTAPAAAPAAPPAESLPPTVEAYDTVLDTDLKPWLDMSSKLGNVIEGQAKAVQQAFKAQRDFLLIAAKAKKPDISTNTEILKSLQVAIGEVDDIRSGNRDSSLNQPLAMVADSAWALGWVTVGGEGSPKPHEYLNDLFGGAQMAGNKVLTENKDKCAARHLDIASC